MSEGPSTVDLWPHSSRLLQFMQEKRTESIRYTMPGIKETFPVSSPQSDEVSQIMGQMLSDPDLENNQKGLIMLLKQGHLEVALYCTSCLLSKLGQGTGMAGKSSVNSQLSFQIWSSRFQILLALNKYSVLIEEMNPFDELDAPDLYYEAHPNLAPRKGSMIPFAMRLVHADILQHSPLPWKAVERICRLETDVKRVISQLGKESVKEGSKMWNSRLKTVLKLKMRTLYSLGEYSLSMDTAKELSTLEDDGDLKAEIGRAMVRMSVSSGDEKTTESVLSQVAKQSQQSCNSLLVHKAFRAGFHGSFQHALEYIQRIPKSENPPLQVLNTEAICQLYVNNAVGALKTLAAQSVRNIPLTTNLSIIAEIACSAVNKAKLLKTG